MLNLGLEKSSSKSTLYIKKAGFDIVIISLYVNDLLVTRNNAVQIEEFNKEMMKVLEMIDLGEINYFLGMEIKQN